MTLDPRSSLHDVAVLFDAPLTDRALAEALRTLRADPNWFVRAAPHPPAYDLILRYHPVGVPSLTVHLEHVGSPPDLAMWCKTS